MHFRECYWKRQRELRGEGDGEGEGIDESVYGQGNEEVFPRV